MGVACLQNYTLIHYEIINGIRNVPLATNTLTIRTNFKYIFRQLVWVMSSMVRPRTTRRISEHRSLKLAGHNGGAATDSWSIQLAHKVASIGFSWSVVPTAQVLIS